MNGNTRKHKRDKDYKHTYNRQCQKQINFYILTKVKTNVLSKLSLKRKYLETSSSNKLTQEQLELEHACKHVYV